MASTYPLEIIEVYRWVKGNPGLSHEDIKSELQYKNCDSNVKGLVFFPKLLERMNDNFDWINDLGAAFVNQQKAVIDAIQKTRAKAQNSGNLKFDSNRLRLVRISIPV